MALVHAKVKEMTFPFKVYYVRILLIISACSFWNCFCPVTETITETIPVVSSQEGV